MRRASPWLLVLAALALPACAGDSGFSDPSDAGPIDPNPDAAASEDGGVVDGSVPPCFTLTLAPETGAPLIAPVNLVAEVPDAELGRDGAIQWQVRRDGVGHPLEALGARKIRIRATEPGRYVVEATLIDSFEQCTFNSASLDVLARFRYRLTYSGNPGAPPQDERSSFTVVAGATHPALGPDYDLLPGRAVNGTLIQDRSPASSQVLGAQLTLTPALGGRAVTLYSSPTTGAYAGQVLDGRQAIVVVPYLASTAPFALAAEADLLSTSVIVGPHAQVSGEVRLGDASGPLLGGALVSVSTGGVMPALALTGDATSAAPGRFEVAVPGSPQSQLRVEVTHPETGRRGLLFTPATPGPSAQGGPLTIVLDSPAVVPVSVDLTSSAGAAAGDAHVTFIAEAGGVGGHVVQDGVTYPALAGEVRVPAQANGEGLVGPIDLPAARYKVVVEPAAGVIGETLNVGDLDLSSGAAPPVRPVFATAAAQELEVNVRRRGGSGTEYVGKARVTLVARGHLGVAVGAMDTRSSPDDVPAPVSFETSPHMAYDLIIDPPDGLALPRVRVPAQTEVLLPDAIRIDRQLLLPSGEPAAGVHVAVHCEGPSCKDAGFLFAETVTDASGRFVLFVPDIAEMN